MTLTEIFVTVGYLFRQRTYQVALIILRQFSDLAKILLGERHPLRSIFGWLASMHPSQSEDVIFGCRRSISDHFENLLGPLNWSTLMSRLKCSTEVDFGRDVSHKPSLLQDLLHQCEATLGSLKDRTLETRKQLTWNYRMRLDHTEAVRLCWEIVAHAQRPEMSADGMYMTYTEGLYLVAISQYAMGEISSAEVHLREAIDLQISEGGPYNSRARTWLVI